MTSIEKLLAALKEVKAPASLIANAELGMYSDTQSQVAFPIVTLTRHLRDAGLHAIAERAVTGEFDATPEEWDAWIKGEEFQGIVRDFTKEK